MSKGSQSLTAIIGGTGLYQFSEGEPLGSRQTPFGESSADIIRSAINNRPFLFLSRHGLTHSIAPHKINYRANIWALKECGVTHIIAVNAVGGINACMPAGSLVIPDQLIDYSYGREQTYFDGVDQPLQHIDFSSPFGAANVSVTRAALLSACTTCQMTFADKGVYGVTQGPRLETAAEITRMERDGCDIVGMTAMPEAALARELMIDYASLCLVVNPAAGKSEKEITMDQINAITSTGMIDIKRVLHEAIFAIS